ncbi:MAG TPA: bifunctional phosphopantothenoylcysteine decarboxylase/phosphopantothenate--cysteine ligase CoaBC [Gemmatimonadales bacterium]
MPFAGRHVVLGVSGGIASYKSCTLARRLREDGATVDVVLTAAAAEFIRPLTFEALTGRPVLVSLWERDRALAHIALAKEPELVIVAPATANVLARAAMGVADDVLTAILLARRGPILAAPAMNDAMYAHPATLHNIKTLGARGWHFVGPETGPLAEGPSDRPGRMSEPETILAAAARLLAAAGGRWAGRRVIVTAGPTREFLDPVRIITNPSSGRMGFALARAAAARGADVVLVAGPTELPLPPGIAAHRVETTEDMQRAVQALAGKADVLFMAAAPADYRPVERVAEKRPRSGRLTLNLEGTPDILASLERRAGCVVVGFALEAGGADGVARARGKLQDKRLDFVVLNDALEPGAGFQVATNRVTILGRNGQAVEVPLLPKDEVAERILDTVEQALT